MTTITLPIYVLDFQPPFSGVDGSFNTFRLGASWSKRLLEGDVVLLVDTKTRQVFGRAKVLTIGVGPLLEMLDRHAAMNHSQLGKGRKEASDDLHRRILKRYGPRIATDNKATSVIYLRRMR